MMMISSIEIPQWFVMFHTSFISRIKFIVS